VEAAPHVFVAHTDLTKLACDLVLVPTDVNGYVTEHWRCFGRPTAASLPRGWSDSGVRVTNAAPEASTAFGRWVRWVNTGSPTGHEDLAWLREGIRQGLEAAGASLRGAQAQHERARPLVGVPLFGTGAGGFDEVRGQVLDAILSDCHNAAIRHGYDVIIACWHRSDYAALQNQRRKSGIGSSALPELKGEAQRLGRLARAGNLVLFLGAGVSQPAGLPSWARLIQHLAKESSSYADKVHELSQIQPTDAASLLEKDLGAPRFHEILRAHLSEKAHPLGHALLASLRTMETITTNFDTLYEQACLPAFAHPLRTLPREAAKPGEPWLLKMHGDINSQTWVLTREAYLLFDAYWRPLASMVQAAMMTRHMLFIGFSLTDENFIRLGHDVSLLLKRMGRDDNIGTALNLHEDPLREELWQPYLRFVPMGPRNSDMSSAARVLDIFLDLVAMNAAEGEVSYLLDPRYKALVDNADSPVFRKLIELGEAVDAEHDDRWRDIAEFLERYGYPS
jgi:hypothetical protein